MKFKVIEHDPRQEAATAAQSTVHIFQEERSVAMPDIYMKKQIRAIRKKYAYLIRAVEKYGTKQRALAAGNPVTGEGGPDLSEEEIDFALLLSALSTAEQERNALKARCAEQARGERS